MNLLNDNVRIVLVGTTHPGNIGATARAMKTMSQNNLYLVNPKEYPSAEATARATGADDILANAKICPDLKSAISDCELVIATTARIRSIPWPTISPHECSEKINEAGKKKVAIVFGRESSGLSNEEIELSNLLLQIPTNPDYSSLNLASAVQIVCYELFINSLDSGKHITETENKKFVTQEKMELFYNHFEECMIDVDYYDKENPRKLKHRMRRLFNRAQLDEQELNILRGFFTKVQEKIK